MKSAKFIAWLSLRVEPEIRERLDQMALESESSVGEVTRRVIEKGLEAF